MFRRIQPHNTTVTGFNEDHPMSGRQDCADGILFISTYYTKCINNMLQRKSKKKQKTCNNDLLLFSTENFQHTTKTNPKRSHSHFSHYAQESRFLFAQAFRPNLCRVARPSFFCADESRTFGRQGRHSCRVSSGDENGIVQNTAWLFTLERRFLLILKGNNKKCQTHRFFSLVVWLI